MRGGRIRRLIEQNPARSTEIPSFALFPLPYARTHPYYSPEFVVIRAYVKGESVSLAITVLHSPRHLQTRHLSLTRSGALQERNNCTNVYGCPCQGVMAGRMRKLPTKPKRSNAVTVTPLTLVRPAENIERDLLNTNKRQEMMMSAANYFTPFKDETSNRLVLCSISLS